MGERCKELDELQKKHDHFNIYNKDKEMTGTNNKPFQSKITEANHHFDKPGRVRRRIVKI